MKPVLFHTRVASLSLGMLLVLAGCGRKPAPAFTFETTPLTRGDLVRRVTASGTLSAVVSVDVGSQVSGKISVLNADFNSPVRKGELVAEIDPALYSAIVRQAEGELASARATATLKQQNLDRKKILFPKQAATLLDLEQAVAELAQAEATVTIREAALQRARVDLSYCKITAPVDGIVISRVVSLGQTVAATMTTPILFTIAQDITKMDIKASIAEADIGQVKEGQSIEFNVDSFPEEIFTGTVTQVRMAPITTANVVTYHTMITVDNPEKKLFPGMTADVSIVVAERKDVLQIPNTALRFAPPEGTRYSRKPPDKLERTERLAYALEPDGQTMTPIVVRVGITDLVQSEVLGSLSPGLRVVTASTAMKPKSIFGDALPKK